MAVIENRVAPPWDKRDDFAVAAMQGMLGSSRYADMLFAELAAHAYMLADEMLKARDIVGEEIGVGE